MSPQQSNGHGQQLFIQEAMSGFMERENSGGSLIKEAPVRKFHLPLGPFLPAFISYFQCGGLFYIRRHPPSGPVVGLDVRLFIL